MHIIKGLLAGRVGENRLYGRYLASKWHQLLIVGERAGRGTARASPHKPIEGVTSTDRDRYPPNAKVAGWTPARATTNSPAMKCLDGALDQARHAERWVGILSTRFKCGTVQRYERRQILEALV